MSHIVLRQFNAADAQILCPDAVDVTAGTGPWQQWAEFNAQAGPAYTGLLDGKIIGAAGIRMVRPGVGDVWSVFSTEMPAVRLSAFKCLKRMLGILIAEFEFTRLRTDSRVGFEQSQRLLEHLGFVRGRTMRQGKYYFYRLKQEN